MKTELQCNLAFTSPCVFLLLLQLKNNENSLIIVKNYFHLFLCSIILMIWTKAQINEQSSMVKSILNSGINVLQN